jgi:hypothetical protein
MSLSLPLHNLTRVATSAAIVAGAGHRVYKVVLYGTSDAASLKLYDAASATGTEVFGTIASFTDADASAAAPTDHDFSAVGGVNFPNTGIYAAIAGTNAVAYVWWD